ncbi:MAG: FAD binding domain-containing protein [Gaiellaceae bacterium]
MLLSKLGYLRPTSLADAVAALEGNENARLLAGGQTMINVMKTRFASPEVVIDLRDVPGLAGIDVGGDGAVRLGAMVTYDEIDTNPEIREARPVLAEVATVIADQQVRNRGTLGGNVCANDPTNHFPPLMVALDATMTIAGAGGERDVAAQEFFAGVYMTAVESGEVLTGISVPAGSANQGDAFDAATIGKEGTCIVSAAVSLRCNGTIEDARVVVGCVSATPERASGVEAALSGVAPTAEAIAGAVEGLGASLDPPGDVHASADYRRHLAEVVTRRAIETAAGKALT